MLPIDAEDANFEQFEARLRAFMAVNPPTITNNVANIMIKMLIPYV
jgi:hypothetical protein